MFWKATDVYVMKGMTTTHKAQTRTPLPHIHGQQDGKYNPIGNTYSRARPASLTPLDLPSALPPPSLQSLRQSTTAPAVPQSFLLSVGKRRRQFDHRN